MLFIGLKRISSSRNTMKMFTMENCNLLFYLFFSLAIIIVTLSSIQNWPVLEAWRQKGTYWLEGQYINIEMCRLESLGSSRSILKWFRSTCCFPTLIIQTFLWRQVEGELTDQIKQRRRQRLFCFCFPLNQSLYFFKQQSFKLLIIINNLQTQF